MHINMLVASLRISVRMYLGESIWVDWRTTFAIAHRLSTLKGCDRIFVIDDHHIAEMGSHEELMQKEQGIYKGLVEAQLEMHAVKSVEKGMEKN